MLWKLLLNGCPVRCGLHCEHTLPATTPARAACLLPRLAPVCERRCAEGVQMRVTFRLLRLSPSLSMSQEAVGPRRG